MLKQIFIIALCLLLTMQGQAQNPSLPATQITQIEAAIKDWMTQTKAPALSVAIVTENQLRWAKGFGLADVENAVPARAETAYRLASISKTITAVAIMQLVERGKLTLDAPINRYCAAYPAQQKFKDAAYAITVQQLLVHQAGVRHNRFDETNTTKHYATINDAIASFKDDALVAEPESKYSYSTPGYTLLGCAIETASGQPFIEYLRENIFKPAGMTSTFVDDVYALIPHRARGYRKTTSGEVQNAPLHDTSIKVPGGGLATTVEDIAKFAIAVNTHKLVKAETLARMWTKPKTSDGKEQSYAMGFLVDDKNGSLRVFNDGSQPGTRTYLYLMPQQKIAITLMTNLEKAYCEELVPKILATLGVQ